MPGLNKSGPTGQGPLTGRRMGKCNPSDKIKTDDNVKNAITGLIAALIIGLAEMAWNRMKEKHPKSDSNSF
jgi:hypothetical protein